MFQDLSTNSNQDISGPLKCLDSKIAKIDASYLYIISKQLIMVSKSFKRKKKKEKKGVIPQSRFQHEMYRMDFWEEKKAHKSKPKVRHIHQQAGPKACLDISIFWFACTISHQLWQWVPTEKRLRRKVQLLTANRWWKLKASFLKKKSPVWFRMKQRSSDPRDCPAVLHRHAAVLGRVCVYAWEHLVATLSMRACVSG